MSDTDGVNMPGLRLPLLPVRPLKPVDKKRPKGEGRGKKDKKEGGGEGKRTDALRDNGIDIMA